MRRKIPVQQGEIYRVRIVNLTYQGLGVAKVHDFPIFVANSLPGEIARVRVIRVKRHFSFGMVLRLLKKSPDRVSRVNEDYLRTGIAPLMHLKYSAQLKFKRQQIMELLRKAHLLIQVRPTVGMQKPFGYRNKADIPVKLIKGRLETGFYRRRSHYLIPITDFYIQDPKIDHAIRVVRDTLRRFHLQPYNERNHRGVIRTIVVRRSRVTHQMMIGLVTRTRQLPCGSSVIKLICHNLPEVVSVVQNINSRNTNVILGRINRLWFGKPYFEDQLLGHTFRISLNSFYQVNPFQTAKLYQIAIQTADLSSNDVVIDAYCGIGTISLSVAHLVKKVYGVEIVPRAVKDAKVNARINQVTNVRFVTNRAENQIPKWLKQGVRPDVIFVDPPRKGLAASFIQSAVQVHPQRIVYISCNPATLVRDLGRFSKLGYRVAQPIQPVDQFPQTTQIESVTCLVRI